MLIGEARAVSELWDEARSRSSAARAKTVRASRCSSFASPRRREVPAFAPARLDDLELLLPACAAAHEQELGIDPIRRDPDGFRWRTRSQIEEGRSWLWVEDGVILFKAEASAWTPEAVQLQQVWVDPVARRQRNGARGLADLCRLLLERVPTVCLFVRAENAPAIRLYETIGMRARARLPLRPPLTHGVVAPRHAMRFAGSNRDRHRIVRRSGRGSRPPRASTRPGLLATRLADQEIALGVSRRSSPARRRRSSSSSAVVPSRRLVVGDLNEIGFGSFADGPLDEYRAWAASHSPAEPAPGGGESRAAAAARFARGLRRMLERPESVVLHVGHALAVRYVIDAARGLVPAPLMEPVEHADTVLLTAGEVRSAAALLEDWSRSPRFRAPNAMSGHVGRSPR